jgi:hypothetical protein
VGGQKKNEKDRTDEKNNEKRERDTYIDAAIRLAFRSERS